MPLDSNLPPSPSSFPHKVPEFCNALPLDCGPPYSYLSSSMVGEIGRNLLDSFLAYKAAKYCLDKAQNSGLLSRYD